MDENELRPDDSRDTSPESDACPAGGRLGNRIRLIIGLALIVAALGTMVFRNRGRTEPAPTRAYKLGSRPDGLHRMTGLTMGKIPYQALIWPGELSKDQIFAACDRAYEALERVNRVMSAYLPDSDLSRINNAAAGEAVTVEAELFGLLEIARAQTEITDGAFDPTARRLFQLWRIAGDKDSLPTAEQIATVRGRSGWSHVDLDASTNSVTKSVAELQIDLGAIAKGYAVDRVAAALMEAGPAGAMVEVGGEIAVFGASPVGPAWRLGVQHPFKLTNEDGSQATCGAIAITDRAVATSGNYQQFAVIDGQRYSHIVDPRTGWPVDTVPSVTVVANDCMTADAWATSLSVLGEAGLAKVESIQGLEAMLIIGERTNARVVATSGFGAYVNAPVTFGGNAKP